MTQNGDLSNERKRWRETTYAKAKERGGERKDTDFRTSSADVQPLYTPEDVADIDYNRDIGYPGEYPYTRGVQATMYRGRLWTMRQYAGFGTAAETNERFKFLLKEGQTGLSVAFDLPTQIGYDSDDPLAEGEVGKVGVAIDTLADMETMFDGIPLDQVSHLDDDQRAGLRPRRDVRRRRRRSRASRRTASRARRRTTCSRSTSRAAPTSTRRSRRCASPPTSWRTARASCRASTRSASAATTSATPARRRRRRWRSPSPTPSPTSTRRSSAASASTRSAPRISWIFNTHNNFLEEVAKYRALRRMWAKIMRERFGAKDPRSWMLRTHVQTGGATLTAQQPENNIVRAALQALATVLGGVQSLALSCYDEALALPTEEAQRIALRTQQVIAYESGVADTVDPLGGSYYIECADERARAQGAGSTSTASRTWAARSRRSSPATTSARSRRPRTPTSRRSTTASKIIVGVNKFANEDEEPQMIFRVEPGGRARPDRAPQQASARSATRRRSTRRYRASTKSARRRRSAEAENLMYPIVEAVKAYASVGEICGVMREVFGDYQPPTAV